MMSERFNLLVKDWAHPELRSMSFNDQGADRLDIEVVVILTGL